MVLLYNIVVFFPPYIDMNQTLVPMCSPYPEPHSHLPPHPIPLGCPRATALSLMLHASNLHWSSVLHMVIYRFKSYSLKSSHPCLLPHSPKVCSLQMCHFCCLAPGEFNVQRSQADYSPWVTKSQTQLSN